MNFETLKKSHLKRNIIIGVIAVLIISAVILNFTRAKYRVTQSIPLVNGTINYSLADLNIVAITVDGVPSDTIPDGNYNLLDTSYCTVDGEEDTTIQLSYDSATKNFTITPFTTKGTKCYLDFEEVKTPASEIIAGLVGTSDEVVLDEADNARYIGADPNNYVLFNCDDYNNPSSSTCELWRIIGVFSDDTHGRSGEKLVKLIRSESIGNIAWDSGNVNDWSSASLQESLNGSYLSGTNLVSGKGITSATNDMIETVTWKLGGTASYTSASNGLASHFYGYERGETVYSNHETIWEGKIGLMYPSDYGYATSGGSTTNRSSCLAKELYNWDSSSYSYCKSNDWLYDSSTVQWTLTPSSSNSYHVFTVYNSGYVYSNTNATSSYAVRPSVYLKSNIAISGGDGSESNPYTLKQ